ncbi:hypothetical protein niasHT_003475 [Heterodera trifolii]|uniref:EGF-like domain-containing protein n=1 Tax=Heterodera trifolii TaxID=157864 RepID=A0ABD2LVS9_9BILA
MDTKKKTPYFIIEFGQNEQNSAIREKDDGENFGGSKWLNENDGIGSILKDIAPKCRDPCDEYGADCVPIRNLLLKIEALENCGKNESEYNAIFKKPDWAPPLPPAMPWKKRSETMLCGRDMFCDKRRLREQYNRLRKICGLKPEKVESQRKKRQYNPNEKWIESPIKIIFNKKALPDKYGLWDNAIRDFNMSVVAGHELMHALGFNHEQSRSDGRNYVILRLDDDQSEIDPYTKNWLRLRFRINAAIINRIYCKDSCKGHEDKCQNGGYLNPNDCTKCHCPDGYGGKYCKELEENLNCEHLSGIPRELVANQSAVLLKAEAKCGGNWPCRCHWRINPEAGKKVRIQFKSLSNLFECTHNCSSACQICCPRALTDLNGNQYKNWIAAEKPDMDIVISAHLSPKWAVPSTVFELTYESGNVKLINSSKCRYAFNLFAEKRNPGSGNLSCYDGVNGIQIQGKRQTVFTDPNNEEYIGLKLMLIVIRPDTKEIIRVDEVHCLMDDAVAEVPKRLKVCKPKNSSR